MMRIYADSDLDPQHCRKCTFLSFVSLWVAGRDYAYTVYCLEGLIEGNFLITHVYQSVIIKQINISYFPCTANYTFLCHFQTCQVEYTVTKKVSDGTSYKAYFENWLGFNFKQKLAYFSKRSLISML
jgi:hypothetical protein